MAEHHKYDDIINLPHHTSQRHKPMSRLDRAAQFAPFAALTGYDAAIAEGGRITEEKRVLSEDEAAEIDLRLRILIENAAEAPEISVTYFTPDTKKSGGSYTTAVGRALSINEYERELALDNGVRIPLCDIVMLRGEIFRDFDDGSD